MSAFGTKRIPTRSTNPLLGVKRTLATAFGCGAQRRSQLGNVVGCSRRLERTTHEAPPISGSAQRSSNGALACCPRAAEGETAPYWRLRGRYGSSLEAFDCCFCAASE